MTEQEIKTLNLRASVLCSEMDANDDDPEYVRDLERANRAMEDEIKRLTLEIDHKNRIIADMAEQLCPTFMGEPLIKSEKAADDIMNHAMYGGMKGERNAD